MPSWLRKSLRPSLGWAAAIAFVALSTTGVWLTLDKIEKQTRREVGDTLETVLRTTAEAMDNWTSGRREQVATWARSERLLVFTKELLVVERTPGALTRSAAQKQVRGLLRPQLEEHDLRGIFVIAPDRISLASMRDANVGITNLLSRHGNFLDRVFHGETLLSQPISSDVPLKDADGNLREEMETMFVGAPIRDDDGTVIAALTFRLDPGMDFARIAKLGRIGKTGETYIFDRKGRLTTKTRIYKHLTEVGLLKSREGNGLESVYIRDPGGNLQEGFVPATPVDQWPLTRMAASAVSGDSGLDLDGYRDYRGVPVVGAWMWDDEIGFGIATEIDAGEAYLVYRTTRTLVFVASGCTLILFLGLVAVLVWSRRRALAMAGRLVDESSPMLQGGAKLGKFMTPRYVTALLTVAVLIIIGNVVTYRQARIQKADPVVLNISGRQRMLSQRIGLLAREMVDAKTELRRQGARERFLATLNLMAASHRGLTRGSDEMNLPDTLPLAVHDLFFEEPTNLDQRVEAFIAEAQALGVEPSGELTSTNRHLKQINDSLAGNLLNDLDRVVTEYQEASRRKIARLQRLQAVLLGATLLVLTLIAFFVFRPMVGRIESEAWNLVNAERRMRAVMDNVVDGILTIAESGRIESFNSAVQQIFDYTPAELRGMGFHTLLPDFGEGEIAFERYARTREAMEMQGRRKDGSGFVLELSLSEMRLGERRLFVGVVRDITGRQKAEEDVRRLSRAVAATADGVIVTDPAGQILSVNPAFTKMTGYTAEEAIGKTPRVLKSGKQESEFYEEMWSVITGGDVWQSDLENRRKDGTFYHAALTISPILDESGGLGGFVGVQRDITERRRAQEELRKAKEAAEAANRELAEANRNLEKTTVRATEMATQAEVASAAKSEFLANMSHEIRTPMNAIMGMTDLVLESELNTEQRQFLDIVKSSSGSLMTLINDILDFSKIEAGRLDLDPIEFSLRDCLDHTVRTLAVRAEEKNLEMLLSVPLDVPDRLVGDPGRLRQIVVNLLGNAIKFTPKGEIVLHVLVESQAADEVCVHFAVADSGIGIAPDKQRLVFDAFRQADGSSTRKYGGTGLGLAISSQLVEMMEGRIWVESEEGKGSTFHFTATLGLPKDADTDVPLAGMPDVHGARVLVVDDNPTAANVLAEMLTQFGMTPVTAPDGPAALVALEKEPFTMLLVDANMPGMDGFELVERIRENESLAQIPIMMLTAAGRRGDGAYCRKIGIAAYLPKPVQQSDLWDAIVTVLTGESKINEPASLVTQHSLRERRGSLAVLLAEDNEVNQKLATRLLEKEGYLVTVVSDGAEAVEAVENETFELVLMDLQMPNMGGLEATKAIRENERVTGRHVPIIALTAHAMRGDKERCIKAGMDGYATKPIQRQDLFAEIDRVLAARAGPQEIGETGTIEETRGLSPLPGPGSGSLALDAAELIDRVDGDEELLQEILALFLESSPAHLAGLRECLDSGNADDARRHAHSLKGAAANIAAAGVRDTAYQMELAAKENDLAEADTLYEDLNREYEKLKRFLADFPTGLMQGKEGET